MADVDMQEMVKYAQSLGLESKDLDSEVVSCKAFEADDLNKAGLEAQMKYLFHECSEKQIKSYLDSCAKVKKNFAEKGL